MLACKPCITCITLIETKDSTKQKYVVVIDKPLTGVNNYQKLVGKLIHLTVMA